MKPLTILTRANEAWRHGGLLGLRHGWSNLRRRLREERAYRRWMTKHELTDARRKEIEGQIASFENRILLSVLLPVYNVDEKWLRKCIDSVVAQIYPTWQLCIADDASTALHVRPVLEEYAAKDQRINVVFREENGHISAASNSALELATGEFVVLLDHDDELSADALFCVVRELNEFPDASLVFSDEDLIDERGRRFAPKFKPDFSLDLLYSLNFLTHLSAFRTEVVRAVGGFRTGLEGSQDYDLSLRVLEKIDDSQIRHIPRVLYHWRVIEGSVAFSMDEKPYAHERARQAIRDHFARTGIEGEVSESFHNLHRVKYTDARVASVSVIAFGNGDRLSVGNGVEVIESGNNAVALNDAASKSASDVLIFLDGSLRLADPRSMDELKGFAMQRGIGAVGGRIVGNDGFVQEAGIVIDKDLSPKPAHRGYPAGAAGNIFRNRQIGNYSSVSISCLAIRRELFQELGGFDEVNFPEGIFDVDLCLRLGKEGRRIVVLPHVELSREGQPFDRHLPLAELAKFQERWSDYLRRDPFCNPNLKRDGTFEVL